MVDLLVIGAGLCGLCAALTAAEAGLSVRVIAMGMGAIHWSAASVDLLGYLPGTEGPAVTSPLTAIATLLQAQPDHPYSLVNPVQIQEAIELFSRWTAAAGLPYAPASNPARNRLLPSPAGAARPTYLPPVGQAAGDLARPEPLRIVGFSGMRDFYPTLIAANLTRLGYPAQSTFLPQELISPRRHLTPVQMANSLEQPDRQRALANGLRQLVQPGERIGLPAILGLYAHPQVHAALEAQCGVPIFEIPTLPPSVPGMRLYRALHSLLQRLGCQVEIGMHAVGHQADGDQIRWVETATSARPLRHRARAFLLATGGILGGGLESDQSGRCWEPIFDLPLTTPQGRDRWFSPHFLDCGGHPIYLGGVPVAVDWRPIRPEGTPVLTNLWAAGGSLAHTDPIRERSLEGLGIVTGVAAARSILGSLARG